MTRLKITLSSNWNSSPKELAEPNVRYLWILVKTRTWYRHVHECCISVLITCWEVIIQTRGLAYSCWELMLINKYSKAYIFFQTGERGSFSHGSVVDGRFEGFVKTHTGTFYIEPAERYIKDKALPFHSVMYHEDDISKFLFCVENMLYRRGVQKLWVSEVSRTLNLKTEWGSLSIHSSTAVEGHLSWAGWVTLLRKCYNPHRTDSSEEFSFRYSHKFLSFISYHLKCLLKYSANISNKFLNAQSFWYPITYHPSTVIVSGITCS